MQVNVCANRLAAMVCALALIAVTVSGCGKPAAQRVAPPPPQVAIEVARSPEVPFYVPGTGESGIIRLDASMTADGTEQHLLQFVDQTSHVTTPRDSIALTQEDLAELQYGLGKLQTWSARAQREQIRKIFSKTAACFPAKMCGAPEQGVSALVVFTIYEDGATSGQIQVRKGRYQQPYNFAPDDARLLQSHITQVLGDVERAKRNAALTERSLDGMFQ